MKTKIVTLIFIAFVTVIKAQDIPSFTYQQSHFYPQGASDGSSGTTFDPANMCCLYQGRYSINAIDVDSICIAQGGGSALIDLYIPPYVSGYTFSVDDPILAAGNPTIRMALIGEFPISSTDPTNYTQGDIAESDWKFIYSANRLFYNDRNTNFTSEPSIARIAIYNGLNWGYSTLSDYPGDIPLSNIDITWFVSQADSADYVAWANGAATNFNVKFIDNDNFVVYPNPATNNLHLTTNNLQLGENIEILDITGKVVKQLTIKQVKSLSINVSDIKNGVYFIKIGNLVQKFVKE